MARFILEAFEQQLRFGVGWMRSFESDDQHAAFKEELKFPEKWQIPVPEEVYEEAARTFSDLGFVAHAGPADFVLEVLMSDDANSRMFDPQAQTALLTVETDNPHPLAGVGYLATISLPIAPPSGEAAELARTLNELELQQKDFPPKFGSWGLQGAEEEFVYNCFLPTSECYGNLHQIMMSWNIQRVLWLRKNHWDPRHGLRCIRG